MAQKSKSAHKTAVDASRIAPFDREERVTIGARTVDYGFRDDLMAGPIIGRANVHADGTLQSTLELHYHFGAHEYYVHRTLPQPTQITHLSTSFGDPPAEIQFKTLVESS